MSPIVHWLPKKCLKKGDSTRFLWTSKRSSFRCEQSSLLVSSPRMTAKLSESIWFSPLTSVPVSNLAYRRKSFGFTALLPSPSKHILSELLAQSKCLGRTLSTGCYHRPPGGGVLKGRLCAGETSVCGPLEMDPPDGPGEQPRRGVWLCMSVGDSGEVLCVYHFPGSQQLAHHFVLPDPPDRQLVRVGQVPGNRLRYG